MCKPRSRLHVWGASSTTFEAARYGAYLVSGNLTHGVSIDFLQNTTATHAVPLFTNLAASALLKLSTADDTASITVSGVAPRRTCTLGLGVTVLCLKWWPSQVSNWPLAYTDRQRSAGQSVGALFAAIIIVLAFAFIPAAFIGTQQPPPAAPSHHLEYCT